MMGLEGGSRLKSLPRLGCQYGWGLHRCLHSHRPRLHTETQQDVHHPVGCHTPLQTQELAKLRETPTDGCCATHCTSFSFTLYRAHGVYNIQTILPVRPWLAFHVKGQKGLRCFSCCTTLPVCFWALAKTHLHVHCIWQAHVLPSWLLQGLVYIALQQHSRNCCCLLMPCNLQ